MTNYPNYAQEEFAALAVLLLVVAPVITAAWVFARAMRWRI